jgi:hypothetical protein
VFCSTFTHSQCTLGWRFGGEDGSSALAESNRRMTSKISSKLALDWT